MKKRLLALLMAGVMMTGIAGCGKTEQAGGKDGLVNLTWIVPVSEQADSASVLAQANKIIEEKIGAHLDVMFIDPSSYGERMKMNMASGNAYDLCFTSNWLNVYVSAVEAGGLMDITDYITDDLRELVPEYILNQAAVDGRIYAVPNIQVMTHPCSIRIQKRLADKYNLDVSKIKTIEDMEPFFEQIKQNEPDIYPYRTVWDNGPWTRPLYEQIYASSNIYIKKDSSSTELLVGFETPEFQRAIAKLREWYEKGYIRSDVASAANDTAGWNAGKYAADITTWKPGQEALDKAQGYEYVYAPLHEPYMLRDGASAAMTGVGANSKNPEKAVELIALMNSDKDLYNLICYGIQGTHYNLTEDNKIAVVENSGYKPGRDWVFGNQFNAYVSEGADADVWEKTDEMNNNSIKSPLIGFTPDVSAIRMELSQLASVADEFAYMFTGAYAVEDYWEEYVSKMEMAGVRKVRDELQKQVDEFLASK